MFSHQSVVQGRLNQQTMIRLWISIFTSQTLLKLPDLWSSRVAKKPTYVLKTVKVWVVNNTMCVNIISDEIPCICIVLCKKLKHSLKRLQNISLQCQTAAILSFHLWRKTRNISRHQPHWHHTQEHLKGENKAIFKQQLDIHSHPQYLERAASTASASKLPSPVAAHCVRAARHRWAAAWSRVAFT